jgi:2-polyprenyl-3-methyl-5-hydroxy-6-metoxy-1,4-benzoquinol methylase
MPSPQVDRAESKAYYENFSFRVGQRDWLLPNRRHAQLRVFVRDVLGAGRDRTILDVGCGAGVMTSFLTRFGTVMGTDFSTAAIEAARRIVPGVDFVAGTFDDLPRGRRFDAVMLFDVLEHIPAAEREGFLGQLEALLAEGGLVFVSTPHPAATRHKKEIGDPHLQVIDEEVELVDVVAEAASAGLQLVRYQAYDVFRGSPEYQFMVFTRRGAQGGPPVLRDPRAKRPGPRAWRWRNAARSLRAGRRGVARWFLDGTPPDIKS